MVNSKKWNYVGEFLLTSISIILNFFCYSKFKRTTAALLTILFCIIGKDAYSKTDYSQWLGLISESSCTKTTDEFGKITYQYLIDNDKVICLLVDNKAEKITCQFVEEGQIIHEKSLNDLVSTGKKLNPHVVHFIRQGMSEATIINILGQNYGDIGSGVSIYEWKCIDGSKIELNLALHRAENSIGVLLLKKNGRYKMVELKKCDLLD